MIANAKRQPKITLGMIHFFHHHPVAPSPKWQDYLKRRAPYGAISYTDCIDIPYTNLYRSLTFGGLPPFDHLFFRWVFDPDFLIGLVRIAWILGRRGILAWQGFA